MTTRYVSCMIIAHGKIITEYTNQHIIDSVQVNTAVPFTIATFAGPAETCTYPPDELIKLKDTLLKYGEQVPDERIDQIFPQLVNQSQVDSLGVNYGDPTWANYFSNRPMFTENWIRGNNYIEKKYTKCPDMQIECGIYILKNNVGITPGSLLDLHTPMYFSEIVHLFAERFKADHVYIVDCACSVVVDPDGNNTVDSTTIRKISRNIVKLFSNGGKGGNKTNGKSKSKSKSKSNNNNKTRRIRTKK